MIGAELCGDIFWWRRVALWAPMLIFRTRPPSHLRPARKEYEVRVRGMATAMSHRLLHADEDSAAQVDQVPLEKMDALLARVEQRGGRGGGVG